MSFCTECETYIAPELEACPRCGTARPAPPQPTLAWPAALDAPPDGPPLAGRGLLLLPTRAPAGCEAELCAFALADGSLRWRLPFAHAVLSGIAVNPDLSSGILAWVSTASTDLLRGEGALMAVNAEGEIVWRWPHGASPPQSPARLPLGTFRPKGGKGGPQLLSAPVLAGDRVGVVADTNTLCWLDAATGEERGHAALDAPASARPPALAGEVVLIPGRGPHLLAVGLDGGRHWRFALEAGQRAWLDKTPVVVGPHLFTVSSGGEVLALRVADGGLVWRSAIGPPGKELSAPATDGSRLYLGARDGLHALNLADGSEAWPPFHTDRRIEAAPVVCGGVVTVACHDHHLYALDALTGRKLWQHALARRITVPPVLTDCGEHGPCVVVVDREGTLTALARPLSLAEHEAAGHWVTAAGMLAARGEPARGAALLQAHGEPLKAAALWLEAGELALAAAQYEAAGAWRRAVEMWEAEGQLAQAAALLAAHGEAHEAAKLWEEAGELALAAAQYEAAGMWEHAADLWHALRRPLRQAEAFAQCARTLEDASVDDIAVVWAAAAEIFEEEGDRARALACRHEEARCLRQPIIELDIEHEGLVWQSWSRLRFIVRNIGFGPARRLVIRTTGEQFKGQVMHTQRLAPLKAKQAHVQQLDVRPLEWGESVPLRVEIQYWDLDEKFHAREQTLYIPVAQSKAVRQVSTRLTDVLRRPQVLEEAPFADLEVRIWAAGQVGKAAFHRQSGEPDAGEDTRPRDSEIAAGRVEIRLNGEQESQQGALGAGLLPWASSGDPAADGQRLFKALVADARLRDAWAHARGQAPRRRVRLWIDAQAPALHALPWELLRDGDRQVAASEDTPFSRYLPVWEAWGQTQVERPIRVLAVIPALPDLEERGLTPLNVALERKTLAGAFSALDASQIKVDFLERPVTLAHLEERLREGYHSLHFVGHGMFNATQQQGGLYMEDEGRRAQVVTGHKLGAMLARQGVRPHLVFLAVCQSAVCSPADAFRGVAQCLVQAGVPAVVAMQGAVAIKTARMLSEVFYRRLADHGVVDRALNEARSTLLTVGRPDAGVPALFMRLKNGKIWTIKQA